MSKEHLASTVVFITLTNLPNKHVPVCFHYLTQRLKILLPLDSVELQLISLFMAMILIPIASLESSLLFCNVQCNFPFTQLRFVLCIIEISESRIDLGNLLLQFQTPKKIMLMITAQDTHIPRDTHTHIHNSMVFKDELSHEYLS